MSRIGAAISSIDTSLKWLRIMAASLALAVTAAACDAPTDTQSETPPAGESQKAQTVPPPAAPVEAPTPVEAPGPGSAPGDPAFDQAIALLADLQTAMAEEDAADLLAVADRMEAAGPEGLTLSLRDWIAMQIELAQALAALDAIDEAQTLIGRALEDIAALPDRVSTETLKLEALQTLVPLQLARDDIDGARASLLRIETIYRETLFREDHPALATRLDSLAAQHRQIEAVSGARQRSAALMREAERIRALMIADPAGVEARLKDRPRDGGGSRKQRIPVFYGTTRARTGEAPGGGPCDFAACYGSDETGTLDLGVALVSIPDDHEFGRFERNNVFLLEFTPDPKKHIVTWRVDPLDRKEFLAALDQRMDGSQRREAFLFVHGYRTGFEGGILRTGQMAFDLDIDGAAFHFSWPSKGSVAGYLHDNEQANDRVNWRLFGEFLDIVLERSGAERVLVMAHSMGNEIFAGGFERYLAQLDEPPAPVIDEMVFAAPDMSTGNFRDFVDQAAPWIGRMTLYSSKRDKALGLSQYLSAEPRAGNVQPPLVRAPLQTVDASLIPSDFWNHNYYNTQALYDIAPIAWCGLQPQNRCFLRAERLPPDDDVYWTYDDTLGADQCEPDVFRAALTLLRARGPDNALILADETSTPDALPAALDQTRRSDTAYIQAVRNLLHRLSPLCRTGAPPD